MPLPMGILANHIFSPCKVHNVKKQASKNSWFVPNLLLYSKLSKDESYFE